MDPHRPVEAAPVKTPRRIFRLTLRALPGEAPAEVRLRRALKVLLRAFRFRAERVEDLGDGEPRGPPRARASGTLETFPSREFSTRPIRKRKKTMDHKRREPAVGTPEPHDFFACAGCEAAGKDIMDSAAKISRWSDALVTLSPPAEIGEGEDDPDKVRLLGGISVFTLTEGLAHAIFYVSERLQSNLPGRVVCEEELDRLRDVPRAKMGPRAVPR
jgi:hypothetical protein